MVTPLGNNATDTWQNVLAGKSGTGPLTKFQLDGLDPQV
jgi:3-oxoacyl-[acyl-carrier-protein] synthase II